MQKLSLETSDGGTEGDTGRRTDEKMIGESKARTGGQKDERTDGPT